LPTGSQRANVTISDHVSVIIMVLNRPILSEMYPENERPNAEPLTSKISEGRKGGGQSATERADLRIQDCDDIEARLATKTLLKSVSWQ
jgi:hypothetical protein